MNNIVYMKLKIGTGDMGTTDMVKKLSGGRSADMNNIVDTKVKIGTGDMGTTDIVKKLI